MFSWINQQFRYAEINEVALIFILIPTEEDILGFKVPVYYSPAMDRLHNFYQLICEL